MKIMYYKYIRNQDSRNQDANDQYYNFRAYWFADGLWREREGERRPDEMVSIRYESEDFWQKSGVSFDYVSAERRHYDDSASDTPAQVLEQVQKVAEWCKSAPQALSLQYTFADI